MAEVPALGQFGTPQALCSASVLPVSAQAGTRGQVRGKQMVRVECPGFFTHERTDGLPPSGAGRPAPIPD